MAERYFPETRNRIGRDNTCSITPRFASNTLCSPTDSSGTKVCEHDCAYSSAAIRKEEFAALARAWTAEADQMSADRLRPDRAVAGQWANRRSQANSEDTGTWQAPDSVSGSLICGAARQSSPSRYGLTDRHRFNHSSEPGFQLSVSRDHHMRLLGSRAVTRLAPSGARGVIRRAARRRRSGAEHERQEPAPRQMASDSQRTNARRYKETATVTAPATLSSYTRLRAQPGQPQFVATAAPSNAAAGLRAFH